MSKLGRCGSIGVEQGVDWVHQQPVRPTQLLHVVFLSGNVLVGWEINSLYWADQAGFTFIFVSGGKLRILDPSRTFLFAAAMEEAAPPIIACILTDLLAKPPSSQNLKKFSGLQLQDQSCKGQHLLFATGFWFSNKFS